MKISFIFKILSIIILTICFLSLNNFQGIYSKYSEYIDIEGIKKLKYIDTSYIIEGKGKTSIETIKYFINDTITIEESCEGDYGYGYYIIKTDRYYRPIFMETKWVSEIENANSFERFIYNYENGTIIYTNLINSKTKTFSLKEITGDSVTLGELLIFIKNDKMKNLSTGGLIVPNAYQAPFIFRFIKKDQYILNDETIPEEVYKVELNNPFMQFIASMFGNKAEIHIRTEFPHIRTRSFYSTRNIYLKDYKIITK